jgi:hypothetical protein
MIALIALALASCAGGEGALDRAADRLAPADTAGQRAFRAALYAAPLIEMAHSHSPTARRAACEAAATMLEVRALAESGQGLALALGLTSRVLLTVARAVPMVAAGGPVTQATALARVALALPAIPGVAVQIDVGKAVLAEAVTAGRDPTPAEWDLILDPAEDVAQACGAAD